MELYLHEELKPYLSAARPGLIFDKIMALRGECYRNQEGRLTQRVQIGERYFFLKQHYGVGWGEIFKSLLHFRQPVISAKPEWQAIKRLHNLNVGVPTVYAYGSRGFNPARKRSFILLEALTPSTSLETLTQDWQTRPPAFAFKLQLIREVARIARALHIHNMTHRDFYLCHFLLRTSKDLLSNSALYLIDLHRAQVRGFRKERWIIKDLAGLYFSSKDAVLTQRDLFRFMRFYRNNSFKMILRMENQFWQKVMMRGEQQYRKQIQG